MNEKPKLRQSTEAVRLLDDLGRRNPYALAALMQLLAGNPRGMLITEFVHHKHSKKAIEDLRKRGLVEQDSEDLFITRLINSEIVEFRSAVQRKKEPPKKDWRQVMIEKGGDPDKLIENKIVKEGELQASFYLNELANHYNKDSEAYKRYRVFVFRLYNSTALASRPPLNNILRMSPQMDFLTYQEKYINVPSKVEAEIIEGMDKHETIVKRIRTHFPGTYYKWVENAQRRMNQ